MVAGQLAAGWSWAQVTPGKKDCADFKIYTYPSIHTPHYIFCKRNKPWCVPEVHKLFIPLLYFYSFVSYNSKMRLVLAGPNDVYRKEYLKTFTYTKYKKHFPPNIIFR